MDRDKNGRFIKGNKLGVRFQKGCKPIKGFTKGNQLNLGRKHSEKSKLKMSLVHKGYKASNVTKLKMSLAQIGNKHAFKNGKYKDGLGYILIYSPDHPYSTIHKYVPEHRLVMEKHLNRYLTSKEVVHHINGIKDDNRIENLSLFKNQNEHFKHHWQLKIAN